MYRLQTPPHSQSTKPALKGCAAAREQINHPMRNGRCMPRVTIPVPIPVQELPLPSTRCHLRHATPPNVSKGFPDAALLAVVHIVLPDHVLVTIICFFPLQIVAVPCFPSRCRPGLLASARPGSMPGRGAPGVRLRVRGLFKVHKVRRGGCTAQKVVVVPVDKNAAQPLDSVQVLLNDVRRERRYRPFREQRVLLPRQAER